MWSGWEWTHFAFSVTQRPPSSAHFSARSCLPGLETRGGCWLASLKGQIEHHQNAHFDFSQPLPECGTRIHPEHEATLQLLTQPFVLLLALRFGGRGVSRGQRGVRLASRRSSCRGLQTCSWERKTAAQKPPRFLEEPGDQLQHDSQGAPVCQQPLTQLPTKSQACLPTPLAP